MRSLVSERSEQDTLWCTECNFAIYIYMEVRMSCSIGIHLRKAGGIRPQLFFRLAAWAELSIYHWIWYEH